MAASRRRQFFGFHLTLPCVTKMVVQASEVTWNQSTDQNKLIINAWSSGNVCLHKWKAVWYRGIPKVTQIPPPPPQPRKQRLPESNVNFFIPLERRNGYSESSGPKDRSGLLKTSLIDKVSVVNRRSCGRNNLTAGLICAFICLYRTSLNFPWNYDFINYTCLAADSDHIL